MRTRRKYWRKRPDDITNYFDRAIAAGKTQEEMAVDLGVTKTTVRAWLADLGYELVYTYRRRRGVAA